MRQESFSEIVNHAGRAKSPSYSSLYASTQMDLSVSDRRWWLMSVGTLWLDKLDAETWLAMMSSRTRESGKAILSLKS